MVGLHMSVLPSDIAIYGSINMPEADGILCGGAIDFTKRIDFSDISPNGTLSVVSSSSSDIATKITYLVRDPTGVVQTINATLTGTTPVNGTQASERLLAAAITNGAIAGITNPGGTAPIGDIALYATTAIVSNHTTQSGSANPTGATPALMHLQVGDGAVVSVGQIIRITSGTGINQMRKIIAVTGYGTDMVAVSRAWTSIPGRHVF
jgi:hypothetical protein